MHLALAMADECLAGRTSPMRMTHISADFRRPAIAGRSIEFAIRESSEDRIRIEAISERLGLMCVAIQFSPRVPAVEIDIPATVPHSMQPKDRSLSEVRGCGGRLPVWMDSGLAATLFPNLVRLFPPVQLAVLLATSRLVGMEVPGLHSVWRSFHFSETPVQSELTYEVERIDERFSLVELRMNAPGLSGTLSTSMRPESTVQAAYDVIQSQVNASEFRGERALVIGGSRGLGEVAVKLLAAGGADVRFSYHRALKTRIESRARLRRQVDWQHASSMTCWKMQPDCQSSWGTGGPLCSAILPRRSSSVACKDGFRPSCSGSSAIFM